MRIHYRALTPEEKKKITFLLSLTNFLNCPLIKGLVREIAIIVLEKLLSPIV
jgi:hypothetical protein